MKNIFGKFGFLILLGFFGMALLTSCSEEANEIESVENFVDDAVESLERAGKFGKRGCFEFVFPISIDFPDESSSTVEDYATLKTTIKEWKEANPEAEEKPSLAFPLEILGEDGTATTVASQEELLELRKECRRTHFDGKRKIRRFFRSACFKPVFPLSVEFPNGTIVEAANATTLKTVLREWKENVENPDGRPQVIFPIEVEYTDGTIVEVADKEALKALKDTCDQN